MLLLALLLSLSLALLPAVALADGIEEGAPDEPYGTQPQVTDDGRLFAWLYLPGLPTRADGLEALRVERAPADDAGAWTPHCTFVWDEDWQEFAALENPFLTIRYYNYDTGEDVPFVDYFEAQTSGRSFYLRAFAVIAVEGESHELSFAPVFFPVPGDEGPDEEEPEDGEREEGSEDEENSGGSADGGGSGGDKGGIGQGENDRPVIDVPKPPSGESAGAGGNENAKPPDADESEKPDGAGTGEPFVDEREGSDPVAGKTVDDDDTDEDGLPGDGGSEDKKGSDEAVAHFPSARMIDRRATQEPASDDALAPAIEGQNAAAESAPLHESAAQADQPIEAAESAPQQTRTQTDPQSEAAAETPARLPGSLAALGATVALAGIVALVLRARRT